MINTVHIPQTRQGITDAIAYKMNILDQWNAKNSKKPLQSSASFSPVAS